MRSLISRYLLGGVAFLSSVHYSAFALPNFDDEDLYYLREDLASFTATASEEELALAAQIKTALVASADRRESRQSVGGALGYQLGDVLDESMVIDRLWNNAEVSPALRHPLIEIYRVRQADDNAAIDLISGFANHDSIADCMQAQQTIVTDLHAQFPDALLLSAAPSWHALLFTNDAIISVVCRNDTNHKRENYQLGYYTQALAYHDWAPEIELLFVDAISIDAALTRLGKPTKFINFAIPNNIGVERALAIYEAQ